MLLDNTAWVLCKECIYFDDCDIKEVCDGCYLGDREEINND